MKHYKLEDWQIEKIKETLQVAQNSLLGITALDTKEEIAKKRAKYETCLVRMIDKCLGFIEE